VNDGYWRGVVNITGKAIHGYRDSIDARGHIAAVICLPLYITSNRQVVTIPDGRRGLA